MKGKVLPYPAEVKTETFSEKYDGPTARLTKSFETGDPMRKGCSNSNKGDYNFEALAASNQTIAYSPLTAVPRQSSFWLIWQMDLIGRFCFPL